MERTRLSAVAAIRADWSWIRIRVVRDALPDGLHPGAAQINGEFGQGTPHSRTPHDLIGPQGLGWADSGMCRQVRLTCLHLAGTVDDVCGDASAGEAAVVDAVVVVEAQVGVELAARPV